MYHIITKVLTLLAVLAILSACNLREDMLLPPNLDPKDYVTDSTIRVYADHLIHSSNDNSYAYIYKESIADSLLWYGDLLDFKRVDSLLERDSLALATGTQALSQSYELSIMRSGAKVILDSIPAFATIYTNCSSAGTNGSTSLLTHRYMLAAPNVELYSYGASRCFFDLDGSGEFSLVDFPAESQIEVKNAAIDVEALLITDTDYIQFWLPQGFMADLGNTTIKLEASLNQEMVQTVQGIYPGFFVRSKVLTIETQNPGTSSETPILHYRMPTNRHFGTQWLKLNSSGIHSWQNGEDTWQFEENKLISFFNGAGSYLLIDPISGQNNVQVELDGRYTQLFLQDIWVDLGDTHLPNHSLNIDLAPNTSSIVTDFFSANPFSISGSQQAYNLSFTASGEALETLPNDAWIEFGFKSANLRSSNRLMRVYRNSSSDHIDFKTYGSDYDANHYSTADSYVYSGVNSSGTYLYGAITESNSKTVLPCLKTELQIQTAKTFFSWNDPLLNTTQLSITYNPSITGAHPWINGSPYTLNSGATLMQISAMRGRQNTDLLPANFFLSTALASAIESVINFTPSTSYPRFIRYRAAADFAHNTFVYKDGKLQISPAYSGYLFNASQLRKSKSTSDLALFSRMVWDDYEWELMLDSANPMPAGASMRLSVQNTLMDAYNVFANQYQFRYLTPSYKFAIQNSPDFYASFQPYIRLRESSRLPRQLFSVSDGEFYRVYSYPEGTNADGWHFTYADGHIAFVLVHDAEYAAVEDQQPHTQVSALVANSTRDYQLSLYQAQFTLPSDFIGNLMPTGSRVLINSAPTNPPAVPTLSAYSLQFLNSSQQVFEPGFYQYPAAPRWPFIYIPIPDYSPGQSVHLFFRNMQGATQEFTRVTAFSDIPAWEYMLVGNCAVCFVNNSGLFYTTQ